VHKLAEIVSSKPDKKEEKKKKKKEKVNLMGKVKINPPNQPRL
jgi:hypothetical protein